MTWSGYRSVWTFVMFDLPVKTKDERRAYTQFRNALLKLGFIKMQFSVYVRFAANDEKSAVYKRAIKEIVPQHGEVRIIEVTGKQFEKMTVYYGKVKRKPETEPLQLEFF